jgi:hypothetical protein
VPILIHGLPKGAFFQNHPGRCRIEAHRPTDLQQNRSAGDIFPVLEIGEEHGVVKGIAAALILGPFSQFLSQAAVEGHRTLAEGQLQFIGHLPQAGHHRRDIHRPAGEQRFERLPGRRRFRMQGKGRPLDVERKCRFDPFNTPGTEVAPGSDVVGEDLQDGRWLVFIDHYGSPFTRPGGWI